MRVLLLLGLTLSFFNLKAQNKMEPLGKINIASPTASSITKYGDIPVNYHTGIPSISVPIYTVKQGSLSVPIQLSYHAGGLKVDETPSWVGAGWSLMAGGVITRTVRDKPDEHYASSSFQAYGHFSDYGLSTYLSNVNGSNEGVMADTEPDIFSFNFNGVSGKFFFNDDRIPVLLPEQDIKIEYVYKDEPWLTFLSFPGNNTFRKCIESFILTLPNGTKYFFGVPSTPESNPFVDPVEVTSIYTSRDGVVNQGQVISSWYLYKIVSVNNSDQIVFKYERDRYALYTYGNGRNMDNYDPYYLMKTYITGVRLSKIIYSIGSIDFIAGLNREDVSGWTPASNISMADEANTSSKSLGSIQVKDNSGATFKRFNFTYGYFNDWGMSQTYAQFQPVSSDRKRLKLLSVVEQNGNGTESLMPYTFEYFEDGVIPRRLSFSKDHWGFNNGAANAELYPAMTDNTGASVNSMLGLSINNRESSWPHMRLGSIKKITYPTGGSSEFEFEHNRVNTTAGEKMVGGLRIKKITSYDGVTSIAKEVNYTYTKPGTSQSSGALFGIPVYVQVFRNDNVRQLNWTGSGGNGCIDPGNNSTEIRDRQIIVSDNSVRPMESTQGNHIGYEFVRVADGQNNGYTVYQYQLGLPLQQPPPSAVAITYVERVGPCPLSIPNYPAAPLEHNFYRGELLSEKVYNSSEILLREKNYGVSYQMNPVTTPGRVKYISNWNLSGSGFVTWYELKTARKVSSSVQEKVYAGSSFIENNSITYYESLRHLNPTRVVTTSSKGETVEKRFKYAEDFFSTSFDTIGKSTNFIARGYLDYVNYLLYGLGYYDELQGCGGATSSCFAAITSSLWGQLSQNRKQFLNYRRLALNNVELASRYQSQHNLVKANAGPNYKNLLWLHDINQNDQIESTSYLGSYVTSSSYQKVINNLNSSHGLYPATIERVDFAVPEQGFNRPFVNESTVEIETDSRYRVISLPVFNKGNLVNLVNADGVVQGYKWSSNGQNPIASAVGAYNRVRDSGIVAVTNAYLTGYLSPSNQYAGVTQSFEQVTLGNIYISMPTPPPGAVVNGYFVITGPVNQTVYLCAKGFGASGCTAYPSSTTFSNMPQGNYTITANLTTSFGSYGFSYGPAYAYLGRQIVPIGNSEFFFEDFEDMQGALSGDSFTGSKYFSGSFYVDFLLPNSRNYVLQWWSKNGSTWQFNQQAYTGSTTISGIIDQVRVVPTDAQLTTYSWHPVLGIVAVCDPNNRVTYYEYDGFGRLKYVRDDQRNIIKSYDYQYNQAQY